MWRRATMIIRYENTVEDMVVFCYHYYDHSPAQRRTRIKTIWGTAVVILLGYSLLAWVTQKPSWLFAAIVVAVLIVLIMPLVMRRSVASNARRMYGEGANNP